VRPGGEQKVQVVDIDDKTRAAEHPEAGESDHQLTWKEVQLL